MKLTKAEIKEAVAVLYGALCEGQTELELLDDMGITAEDFANLKREMFEEKANEVRARPTEHTYVQYMIDQTRNLEDLNDMIKNFKETKQYNAMVGAIRARSEIYDKLIAKGQEFGLIKKMPDKKEIVAGVLVAELSSKELKTMITKELANLNSMIRLFGDRDIMDIKPGAIHVGPALPAAVLDDKKPKKSTKPSKFNKAKGAKRSGGRVVKRKKKPME